MAEKKKIPTWAWQILSVSLFLLLLFFWYKSCNRKSVVPLTNNDSTVYWRNKVGEEVASRKAAEDQFSIFNEEYLDSIARLLDTKAKLLNQITVLTQKGTVTIKTSEPPIIKWKTDTVTSDVGCPDLASVEQNFYNPYYKANVFIPFNGDSSRIRLETYDTLLYADKIVKEGNIFNRKRFLQVDVTNTNDSAHITGLNIYRKQLPPPKRIGIGVQLGARVTITKNFIPAVKPYAGIGASYNFIRL